MARAKIPVSINGLEFDALISEERSLTAQVPSYSVEDGYSVSDSIILDAEGLSLTLYVTDTPVTWHSRHSGQANRVQEVLDQLEKLYLDAAPVKIVTSDRIYTDMAIESLTLSKSADEGYGREVPISFKKIRTTKSTTTQIPSFYNKSGSTGAPAGTASVSSAPAGEGGSGGSSSDGGNKSSILYGAAKACGLV